MTEEEAEIVSLSRDEALESQGSVIGWRLENIWPLAWVLGYEAEPSVEGSQIHPMHLHGMAQLVIAKDGYPLANPQEEDTVTVAPGERYTVLVHATEPGTWVWHCHILPHAESSKGMFGMVTALVVK